MNASDTRLLELALKKQQLQFNSALLRDQLASNAAGLSPIFSSVDKAYTAGRWLRKRPAIPLALTVALIVAKPRRAWRWARRSFVIWKTWRGFRRTAESILEHL